MRVRSVPLIALTAWALAAPVDARTWTSAGGKQLEAELVDRKGGQVVLEKADGSRVSIAEQRLSAADQDYLRSLSPTTGPAAAPAAATEAVPASSEPTLAPGFVGRPDFDTRDGEVSAGTCFLVEYPGQAAPLLLTAHHLFGAAGGLKQEVPHDQMPTFARRAAFDDLLKGGRTSSSVEGLRIPDSLDVAAFRTAFKGKVAPRALAAANPKKGEVIWLVARLGGQPEKKILHRGVVAEVWADLMKCTYDDADLLTRGASGAPYVNARGEVVGLHTGSFKNPGKAEGSLVPVESLRRALTPALAP